MQNYVKDGVGKCHMTCFLYFGTFSISREWLELYISNLAFRLITRGTNERNAKLGQRGSGSGHVTYFWKFEDTHYISGTVGARNFKFCSSMQNGNILDDQLCQIETGSIFQYGGCPFSQIRSSNSRRLSCLIEIWC